MGVRGFHTLESSLEIGRDRCQAGLNGWKDSAKIVGTSHDEFEHGIDRCIAMHLRIGPPAAKIALEEEVGSQAGQEPPSVQPDITLKGRLGEILDLAEGSFEELDVGEVDAGRVLTETRVVFPEAELAGLFREQLARRFKPCGPDGMEGGVNVFLARICNRDFFHGAGCVAE